MKKNELNEYYIELIDNMRRKSGETEWLEFKVNNANPDMIGEYISAISNSAALHEREKGYIFFGINDVTHEIEGTTFVPAKRKIGNEELENWLATQLRPRIDFRFIRVDTKEGKVVVLEVPAATIQPTSFKKEEYIRVGTYKKLLKDHPEKERNLWRSFDIRPYETKMAKENIDEMQLTKLLDCAGYYTLMNLPLPGDRKGIVHDLQDRDFVRPMDNGKYAITNMGALLFAKDLRDFDQLTGKAIRVIQYKGTGKTEAIRDHFFYKGYAIAFNEVVNYIMTILPQGESIESAIREEFIMFPEKTIREMLGNLCIHQDLTLKGMGPVMEIFDQKVEATSLGALLVDVDRIIDTAPHARNEKLADFLRQVHICEKRGSGFDRMEEGMRDWKIPAPKVETGEDFCRTKIYWHKDWSGWTKEERIRTCYIFTCYCYVNEIEVSNAVLRERFGLEPKDMSVVSRIIKYTLDAGLIKMKNEDDAPKMRRYLPYWA